MREYSTPADRRDPGDRQPHRRRRHATPREAPDAVVFAPPRRRRAGTDVTAAEFLDRGRARSPRVWSPPASSAGDRVALISKTRYEWTLFDYAIWFAGAVTVPVYETSSAEQIEWILARLRRARPWSRRAPTTSRGSPSARPA